MSKGPIQGHDETEYGFTKSLFKNAPFQHTSRRFAIED